MPIEVIKEPTKMAALDQIKYSIQFNSITLLNVAKYRK